MTPTWNDLTRRRRIAVIGSGISGLFAAWRLDKHHDVTLFEAADCLGGHTNTITVPWAGREYSIDTGFIVHNHRNYPNFTRMLRVLGVATEPSTMSFSVECAATGRIFNGSSLGGLFAQRRNLLRPSFYALLRDIQRFHADGIRALPTLDAETTLGDYLDARGYRPDTIRHYVVPIGAAIWSTPPARMRDFPAATFLGFLHNHGMLELRGRPQWRVVSGGSKRYVERLVEEFGSTIHTSTPVTGVRRFDHAAEVRVAGEWLPFDAVVLACHSNTALAMLHDPSPAEQEVLSALTYQPNEAVLHVDESALPPLRRAWAAWNYYVPRAEDPDRPVAVTYDLTTLQNLSAPVRFCVTLNNSDRIADKAVIRRIQYHHPLFDSAAIAAQRRKPEIHGRRRTFFCGAYWGHGFHEDGVVSALDVLAPFGLDWRNEAPRTNELPDARLVGAQ